MEQTTSPAEGWRVIADSDGAAAVIGAVLSLDPEQTYTRSELADAASVPLKDLYLAETLTELVEMGLLRPVEEAGEETYAVEAEAAVYERAAAFEAAVADGRDG